MNVKGIHFLLGDRNRNGESHDNEVKFGGKSWVEKWEKVRFSNKG